MGEDVAELRRKCGEYEEKIQKLDKEASALRRDKNGPARLVRKLQEEFTQATERISRLEEDCREKDQRLEEQRVKLSASQAELRKLQRYATPRACQATSPSPSEAVDVPTSHQGAGDIPAARVAERQLLEAQRRATELVKQATDLQVQLKTKEEQSTEFQAELKSKDTQVGDLRVQLKTAEIQATEFEVQLQSLEAQTLDLLSQLHAKEAQAEELQLNLSTQVALAADFSEQLEAKETLVVDAGALDRVGGLQRDVREEQIAKLEAAASLHAQELADAEKALLAAKARAGQKWRGDPSAADDLQRKLDETLAALEERETQLSQLQEERSSTTAQSNGITDGVSKELASRDAAVASLQASLTEAVTCEERFRVSAEVACAEIQDRDLRIAQLREAFSEQDVRLVSAAEDAGDREVQLRDLQEQLSKARAAGAAAAASLALQVAADEAKAAAAMAARAEVSRLEEVSREREAEVAKLQEFKSSAVWRIQELEAAIKEQGIASAAPEEAPESTPVTPARLVPATSSPALVSSPIWPATAAPAVKSAATPDSSARKLATPILQFSPAVVSSDPLSKSVQPVRSARLLCAPAVGSTAAKAVGPTSPSLMSPRDDRPVASPVPGTRMQIPQSAPLESKDVFSATRRGPSAYQPAGLRLAVPPRAAAMR